MALNMKLFKLLTLFLERHILSPVHVFVNITGAPNDGFLSDPSKRYFRLSGVPLKLCRFILGCAIIFLSVR